MFSYSVNKVPSRIFHTDFARIPSRPVVYRGIKFSLIREVASLSKLGGWNWLGNSTECGKVSTIKTFMGVPVLVMT
jgi:hypothetical protein